MLGAPQTRTVESVLITGPEEFLPSVGGKRAVCWGELSSRRWELGVTEPKETSRPAGLLGRLF